MNKNFMLFTGINSVILLTSIYIITGQQEHIQTLDVSPEKMFDVDYYSNKILDLENIIEKLETDRQQQENKLTIASRNKEKLNAFQNEKKIENNNLYLNRDSNQTNPGNEKSKILSEAAIAEIIQDGNNYQVELDEKIASEPTDETWSINAESLISNVIEGETFTGTTLVNSECKSTLCRIEVKHADKKSIVAFNMNFNTSLQWKSESIIKSAPGNSSIIYIAREGEMLPTKNTTEN